MPASTVAVVVIAAVDDKVVVVEAAIALVVVDEDEEDVRFNFTVGDVGLKLAFLEKDPWDDTLS